MEAYQFESSELHILQLIAATISQLVQAKLDDTVALFVKLREADKITVG